MATSEFTRVRIDPHEETPVLFPALTIEVGLYAAFALMALGMRLFLLDDTPLAVDEARQALTAWHFVSGGRPDAFTGSPLLFSGNTILFALFGASDAAARFLPVLFGS